MSPVVKRSVKLFLSLIPLLLLYIGQSAASPVEGIPFEGLHEHGVSVPLMYGVGIAENVYGHSVLKNPILAQAAQVGRWSAVEQWPLVNMHASMLPDGRIFMWDRENDYTRSFHVFNPLTNSFSALPPIGESVFCAGIDLMPNGQVLMNGGHLSTDKYGIVDSYLYNPATNLVTQSGSMAEERWYPTTITLADGRILTLGGSRTPSANALYPEIYNPATGVWTRLPNPLDVGLYPKVHLLTTGKVLVVNANGRSYTLDTKTGEWTQVTTTVPGGYTSIQYQPNKIVYLGGMNRNTTILDMNATTPSWRFLQKLSYPRYNPNAVILPDGKIFVAGGSTDNTNSDASAVYQSEMWDPATQTWTQLVPNAVPRMYHSIGMLMPDGRVLIAGGGRAGGATNYLSAEYYSPPYLFKGARPTISYAPSEAPYGANITVLTPNAADITSMVLITLPNTTHAFTMSQNFVPLTFTRPDNGRLLAQIPTNANAAPPGFYMLFALNSNGIPSVAKIIKINASAQLPMVPTNTPVMSPTATRTPTATFTPTLTLTPSNTPLIPPTATRTPTATFTPTITLTPSITATIPASITPAGQMFPESVVLDSFNRANGPIGSNWLGAITRYAINSNQLDLMAYDGTIFWKTAFGTTQEAFVTLRRVDLVGDEVSLLLKSQNAASPDGGVLKVNYNPSRRIVQVWTFAPGQGWVQRGTDMPIQLQAGDRFGARVRVDGYVDIYRNGGLIGQRDARQWPFYNQGGYIGLRLLNAPNTLMDDFGGGTTP